MDVASSSPQHVLVYHIGSLGDTLMALPALWALRDLWPGARLVLVTKRTRLKHVVVADSVLEGTGLFSDVIDYPGNRNDEASLGQRARLGWLFARILARRFDTVVYLAPSERAPEQVARDERFFTFAGIGRRIGFRDFPTPPSRAGRPLGAVDGEAAALLARLRRAGLDVPPITEARRDCAVSEREHESLRVWLTAQGASDGGRRWLALAPGSNMPAKIWPLERYARVAARLVEEFDLWPVAFGGPEDLVACTALRDRIGCGHVAAGSLPLRVAAAAMQRCVLYLGNDTGTMHLAASENVPCVVPFPARDFPGKWTPIGDLHAIVRRHVDCEGCMLEICVEERMRCMLDIEADELTAHAQAILRRTPSGRPLRPRVRSALTA